MIGIMDYRAQAVIAFLPGRGAPNPLQNPRFFEGGGELDIASFVGSSQRGGYPRTIPAPADCRAAPICDRP
jgi:hypothetical protein